MINVSKATMEELQDEFVALAVILVDVENQRVAIDTEMQGRRRLASARTRVDAMSDQDKDALREMLKVPEAQKAAT